MPLLAHKIALAATPAQNEYFARAAGTARFVWNWGLHEWNQQSAQGRTPTANALKKQFNAQKYTAFPWLAEIHRDAHAEPFAHLGAAWKRFFAEVKAGKPAPPPRFKKKGRCVDSFYVANDKFTLDGTRLRRPKVGWVEMTEALRFSGKIMGATVSRRAQRWSVAIQVDVPAAAARRRRTGDGVAGVDLGLRNAAILSTGETVPAPKPLASALRRLRLRSRRVSRKVEAAKALGGTSQPPAKGERRRKSHNQVKQEQAVARLPARVYHLRSDFTHKLTTRLCRENQTVVIESLNVKGMVKNRRLARPLSDVGFGRIREQLRYKAALYGTQLILADPWFPSSKLCSTPGCDFKHQELTLSERTWLCPRCGVRHDRDVNSACNLKRLATATALPVAKLAGNGAAGEGKVPSPVGKVTSVKHERGSMRSGQKKNRAHLCALS